MAYREIAAELGCGLGSVQRALKRKIVGVDLPDGPVRSGRPKSPTSQGRGQPVRESVSDAYHDWRKQLVTARKSGLQGVVAILAADPELSDDERAAIEEAGSTTLTAADLKQMVAYSAVKLRHWESTGMMTPQQLATHHNSLLLRMEAAVQLEKELGTARPDAINITFDVNSQHVPLAPERAGIEREPRPAPGKTGDLIDTED